MASNTTVVSKKLNVETANSFVDSIQNDTAYYMFAGKHTTYGNNSDAVITAPTDSNHDITLDAYNNMVFGKKIGSDDVTLMIPRNNWTTGTAYDMYDDDDSNLFTKTFFATVNAGAQYHVYKCLYNNGGGNSTVEPSGTDVTAFESPVDGYIWKYMFSSNSSTMTKFATTEFMPVTPNTAVIAGAINGSIEVIKVEDGGLGYDNYLTDSFRSSSDLRVGGNPFLYAIGPEASTLNDFYNGCILYVTSGAAQGEYKIITDYYISGDQKIAVLDSAFVNTVSVNDTFEIYPYVYVYDLGGAKTSNCIARAIIDENSGNSVSKVEIIQAGAGYRDATALISIDPIVAASSNAVLRAIISPPGGHGSNPATELGANYVGVSVKFIENEEIIPVENDYRQIGILKDPLFANVTFKIDAGNTIGSFAPGELVFQYRDIVLQGSVNTYSNSTITGVGTLFDDSVRSGDMVLIKSTGQNLLANVVSVASNTSLTLNANAAFTASDCSISVVTPVPYGYLSGNSSGEISLSNVNVSGLTTSNKLVGSESYCTTVIDTGAILPISVNGRNPNNYNTFLQLTKFVGTLNSVEQFIEDETVTQESAISYSQPTGAFHSFVENGGADEMYLTNVQNVFQTEGEGGSDGIVTGSNSAASFTVVTKYPGELVPDSGKILYMENFSPISRSAAQSETIKIILQF